MAKSTLILLLAAGVVGFVAASVTLALTGALSPSRRNTARHGTVKGAAFTAFGALLFALHFLHGRWGLASYAGAAAIVVFIAWRQLVRRSERPLHEQLLERPDALATALNPAPPRIRRARRRQLAAMGSAAAVAVLGGVTNLPWLIGAGFVIAVATVAAYAVDLHRRQSAGSLAGPGPQALDWRRILDIGAAVLLAGSIAGIGTAVRGLSYPPDWNQIRYANAEVRYAEPAGNAGELDGGAELNGEPPASYHPAMDIELWSGERKRSVLRVRFGSAHDGRRTPIADDLYDLATRRASAIPRGSVFALDSGEISFRVPLERLPRHITGWRLVVPAPQRGFDAGVFPPYAGPAAVTVTRPPRPLAPIAIAHVSAALHGGRATQSLDGSIRIAGAIPATASTTVGINLVAASEQLPPSGRAATRVTLEFGAAENGSRPLADARFLDGSTAMWSVVPAARATLRGQVVRFHVPLDSVGAYVCCYEAWVHVTASDGGTLDAVAPKPPARPRRLVGAHVARRLRIPGLFVGGVLAQMNAAVLRVAFDVPEMPAVDASLIYMVDLMGRDGRSRAKIVVELDGSKGSLHATNRILQVTLPDATVKALDLPASAVTVRPYGGSLQLRVPTAEIGGGVCCWLAAVTAIPRDGSAFAPTTFTVAARPLGQPGRAVDAGG